MPRVGLALLTGGESKRFGAPKHLQAHPEGGSWGGHLVRIFEAVFPGGPVCVIGEPLPDRPELRRFDDPRQGPAIALKMWAGSCDDLVERWWIVACDQVRWSEASLRAWARRAEDVDPTSEAWVVAEREGRLQPLGGFLAARLLPELAASSTRSMMGLTEALPMCLLTVSGDEWLDVDSLEDLAGWRG